MPPPLRRVVTGVDAEGRSFVQEDAQAPRSYELDRLGGMSSTAIWEVESPLPSVTAGGDAAGAPLGIQPPVGCARVFRFILPPDARVEGDVESIVAEITEKLPSFLEVADPPRGFGMHATDTIDIVYVASGAADLVLETGKVAVRAGDSLVQRGTWHSWSNPYDEPCVFIVTMLRPPPA